MRGFFAALISGAVVLTGHVVGFPMWEDFTAGVVLGSLLGGPTTTMLWDDGHKRKNKRLPK